MTNTRSFPNDISNMHTKYGVRSAVEALSPQQLEKFLDFRYNFLKEEMTELGQAIDILNDSTKNPADRLNLGASEVVDALIDLIVVSLGTLDAFNVDAQLAWDRVLDANMNKEVGIKPTRPNPLGLPDLIKPASWVAPTHMDNVGLFSDLI